MKKCTFIRSLLVKVLPYYPGSKPSPPAGPEKGFRKSKNFKNPPARPPWACFRGNRLNVVLKCYASFATKLFTIILQYRHQQICNAAKLSEGKDPIQKPVRLSKTFNCDICFKTFKRIGHLTVHMKTHSEDNIKYCNTCGKRFKRSDHFKKHVDNCKAENIEPSESLDIHKEVLLEDFPSFPLVICISCYRSYQSELFNSF